MNMNINNVFCYSKDIAKQNGIRLPILEIVISTIVFIVGIIVSAVFLTENMSIFLIIMFAFLAILIYFSVILGLRMKARMTGYATTSDGRVFTATAVNNGGAYLLTGYAGGSIIDQLSGSNNNLGRDIGGLAGSIAAFSSMNKAANYMSNPQVIANLVISPNNSAVVTEILRVYNIIEKKDKFKVICDFKDLRSGRVKYNKTVNIEKSYYMYQQLIQQISMHR